MKYIKGFDLLGLSNRDSRIYTSLIRSGLSSIRRISDDTGINRGTVYESIKKLQAAGLVSYQRANINKKYFAEEPSKILDLIKSKQEELSELAKSTEEVIPLLAKDVAYMPYSNIKFYEDHEGISVILRDVLETVGSMENKEYYAISSKPMRKYLYKKFPGFTKQRIEKNIFVKVIAIGGGGDEVNLASRKQLNTNTGVQPTSYNLIYGDKFATITLNDNMNPYGIVIEDSGVAAMQRLMFDKLWDDMG